ncbi:hypothetical protein [Streptomyces sp. NPDC058092]|uniref:hypothetical protein n=1 Tax=Streptomyces sp. NPDC058092 TaxID=3346336 RepID=UPI0036E54695
MAETLDGIPEERPVTFDGVGSKRFPVDEQGEYPAGLAGAGEARTMRVPVSSVKERCAMLLISRPRTLGAGGLFKSERAEQLP